MSEIGDAPDEPPRADLETAVVENGEHTRAQQRPSLLPVVTPEIIREHEFQKKAAQSVNSSRRSRRSNSSRMPSSGSSSSNNDSQLDHEDGGCLHFVCPLCFTHKHGGEGTAHDPPAICGIPYYLFMTMAALVAAVTTGTVLAVIYYDPSDAVQPPAETPTMAPTTLIPTVVSLLNMTTASPLPTPL